MIMELLMFGLIMLSGVIIFYCLFNIYMEKEVFINRMSNLEEQFKEQAQKQFIYEIQVERSKVMGEKMQKSNAFLNEAIFDLNTNLFEELFPKNNL